MDINTTLDVKPEDKTLSAPSTDIKPEVPVVGTEIPSGQTLKPETTTTEDITTSRQGDVGDSSSTRKSRAAERIGELIRENKALRDEMEGKPEVPATETPVATTYTPPATSQAQDTPEIARARQFLDSLGYKPAEDVGKQVDERVKEVVDRMEARMILDSERSRLENRYTGEDGRPKYNHDDVMTHARRSGIYNPEAAYKDLHEPELLNWAIQQAQGRGATFTEKPTSTSATETGQMDRSALARILASPEGRRWYEDNREKVLSALQKGEL